MVRKYEIAFLLREGEQAKEATGRIKEYVEGSALEISKEDSLGTRDLAYTIIKNRERINRAYYHIVSAEGNPESIAKFEKAVKYDEGVIRYSVFKVD